MKVKVGNWYTSKNFGEFTINRIQKVNGVVTFFLETVGGARFTADVDEMKAEKRFIRELDTTVIQ